MASMQSYRHPRSQRYRCRNCSLGRFSPGSILLLAIYFAGTEQGATSTPEALETEVLLCWGAATPFVD